MDHHATVHTIGFGSSASRHIVRRGLAAVALIGWLPFVAFAGVSDAQEAPRPGSYSLTCWQKGVKVIEKKGLTNMKEFPASGQKPLTFDTGKNNPQPVTLFDLGETICMVQGE